MIVAEPDCPGSLFAGATAPALIVKSGLTTTLKVADLVTAGLHPLQVPVTVTVYEPGVVDVSWHSRASPLGTWFVLHGLPTPATGETPKGDELKDRITSLFQENFGVRVILAVPV